MEFDSLLSRMEHGEKGNPHPQYESYKSYQTPLLAENNRLVKILDVNIQSNTQNVAEQERTLSFISFAAIVKDLSVNSGTGTRKSLISFDCRFGYDNLPRVTVGSIPLSTENNGSTPVLAYLTKTSRSECSEYNLKVFIKTTSAYSRLHLTFVEFCTAMWPYITDNRYMVSGYDANPIHHRLDHYLKSNIESTTAWTAPSTFDLSYTTTYDDNKKIISTEGNGTVTIDADTELIRLQATTNKELKFITSSNKDVVFNGKQIVLIFKSANIKVVSQENYSGGILLKNNTSVTPPNNGTLTVVFYRGAWFEISRSF